jgi:F-type H+-transporting ATPase subunit delta
VTDAQRQSLMEAIAGAMSLSTPVTKMLVLLAKSGKLDLVPELAAAYRERLLSHQNLVRAEVTSAAPLTPEKTRALEDSLSRVTGKKVEVSVSVDPDLLGGVVARIGSTVYDGSVKTQLTRMRQELVKQ